MHLLVLGAFRRNGPGGRKRCGRPVSMHLLVLGAFRLVGLVIHRVGEIARLNAPSGVWCFPTDAAHAVRSQPHGVLMHLLVLGAFRLCPQKTAPQCRLPKRNRRRPRKHRIRPARTAPIKPHNRRKPPQTTPAPPTPPTHQYTTGFQQTQAKKPPPRTFGIVSDTGEKQARRNRPLTGLRQPDITRRPTRTPPVLAPPPASRHRLLTAPPAYPPHAAHIRRPLAQPWQTG